MNGSQSSDDAAGDFGPGRLQLPAMRVLVAPDCYGDSLSAVEAAAAIATGWTRSRPGDSFIVAPQSDGGTGFVEVLASRIGGLRRLRVSGPLDTEVTARWVFDAASRTAYLECAQACGLALLGGPPTPETAMAAHSTGVGQLIAAALEVGAARIVVGLGGSACTDGGKGMVDVLGGRCESGAAIFAELTNFDDDLADADMIVTGEGHFDEQSLHGKVVGEIAAAARQLGIPVIVLAGQVSVDKSTARVSGIMSALAMAEYAGSVRLSLADAANQLMGLASETAARLGNSGPPGYR